MAFLCVAFWPVCIYLFAVGIGLILPVVLIPSNALTPTAANFWFESAVSWGAPVMVIVYAHRLFSRATDWRTRGWILYASWVVVTLLMAFVLSAAFGGVSMAVTEGVAGSVLVRYLRYLIAAVTGTFWAHLFIVPWVFISRFLLMRINQRLLLWP